MGLASFNRARRIQAEKVKENAEAKQGNEKGSEIETESTESLRQEAKEKGLKGYHNMKRETLIEKLRG